MKKRREYYATHSDITTKQQLQLQKTPPGIATIVPSTSAAPTGGGQAGSDVIKTPPTGALPPEMVDVTLDDEKISVALEYSPE